MVLTKTAQLISCRSLFKDGMIVDYILNKAKCYQLSSPYKGCSYIAILTTNSNTIHDKTGGRRVCWACVPVGLQLHIVDKVSEFSSLLSDNSILKNIGYRLVENP